MELQLANPLKICKTLVLSIDERITKTKVFLEGTGGSVDNPELSMSEFLLSLVGKAQQSVRTEVPS